jgi:crotonobetainyl-CoA:carnitine CoA-transferase CaiB-like acyl-CoA transferase
VLAEITPSDRFRWRDLKASASIETMLDLLGHADVFVQNLAPGVAERLGLGARALRERFARLITCSISNLTIFIDLV